MSLSRILTALAALLILAPQARAQFVIPPRGTDATFDAATWNLEFFGEPSQGPNDALQAERVQAVIEQGQIDLWAFQEVVSTTGWFTLLQQVQDEGYGGILGPSVGSGAFNQRLAFIFNPAVVQVLGTITILSGSNFGGRAPFMMTAVVSVGGGTREVRVIALHAKALGDVASYNRRVAGSEELKAYTDGLLAQGLSVLVLGDFNDELVTSTAGGRPSPYLNFANDPAYTFASRRLNDQNIGTFCGSSTTCSGGSTLDHILVAGPLRGDLDVASGDRYGELLTAIPNYPNTTSDHLPVLAQFQLGSVAGEAAPEDRAVALRPAAPSPFRAATTLRFSLAEAADVQIEVVDLLGRTVARLGGAYGAGEHRVSLDGSGLAAGLYRVRLTANGDVQTQTIVRAR